MSRSIEAKTAIEAMKDSFAEQNYPFVGLFWYDAVNKDLYGTMFALAKDVQFHYSITFNKEVRTSSAIEKAVWEHNYKRNKDNRFTGDYTQKPRGRVFEFKDEGFKVLVGEWINEYPEAKEEILYVFQLPKDKTEFVIDEHWDLGHGWSQEF